MGLWAGSSGRFPNLNTTEVGKFRCIRTENRGLNPVHVGVKVEIDRRRVDSRLERLTTATAVTIKRVDDSVSARVDITGVNLVSQPGGAAVVIRITESGSDHG